LDLTLFLSGLLLMLVTLFVSWAVVIRYLNYKPPVWVIQYTEYALLWITFLGTGWLLREKGHIRIDTLVSRLNPTAARWLEIFNDIVGLAVAVVIFWVGSTNTVDLYARGIADVKAVTLPMYALFAVIPFGGLMLLIQFVRDLVHHWKEG
jgi:TRAP-type C4-dicarboxylate transport system permease small subunit